MTQVRYEYLQNNRTLVDAGEEVYDIGSNDIFTRLDVEFKATNGATSNRTNVISDVITGFEIMDGSVSILSLTGSELAGIVTNRLGRFPNGVISEVLSVVQSMRFSIDFGRWYMDEDMALDLSKFKNLQVRIKWNLAAITAVGATGFITGSARLTMVAHIMEGAKNPMGYLTMKRHSLFTTVASGEEQVQLPVDKPIKAIMIRSYLAATGALSGISNVKLVADEGKYKPLDMATADFLASLVNMVDPFEYNHDFQGVNADVGYALVKYRESVKLNTNGVDISAQYVHANIGQGVINAETMSTAVALAVATPMYGDVKGYLPFSGAYLQFGDYANPDSWFNATNFKNAKLTLTQNAAGAVCSVIVEQYTSY